VEVTREVAHPFVVPSVAFWVNLVPLPEQLTPREAVSFTTLRGEPKEHEVALFEFARFAPQDVCLP